MSGRASSAVILFTRSCSPNRRPTTAAAAQAAITENRVCSQGRIASAAPTRTSRRGRRARRATSGSEAISVNTAPGVWKHTPREEEIRDREADGRPTEPTGGAIAGYVPGNDPRQPASDRAEHGERGHDTRVAEHSKKRSHKQRQARRVDRVDLVVRAPTPEIRLESAARVRAIVALAMIVLNPEVVISEKALRDDQVVWFIAVRMLRCHRPGGEAVRGEAQYASKRRLSQGATAIRTSQETTDAAQPGYDQRGANGHPNPRDDVPGPDKGGQRQSKRQPRQQQDRRQPERLDLLRSRTRHDGDERRQQQQRSESDRRWEEADVRCAIVGIKEGHRAERNPQRHSAAQHGAGCRKRRCVRAQGHLTS